MKIVPAMDKIQIGIAPENSTGEICTMKEVKLKPVCAGITIEELPVKTKPLIDTEVLTSIDPHTLEDSFVYVHCHFANQSNDMLIRIWRTTFLIDKGSTFKSKLVHAENISFAPVWTQITERGLYSFLLVFEALPKSCQVFDLVEEISQPGGFFVANINRNQTDIYHINL